MKLTKMKRHIRSPENADWYTVTEAAEILEVPRRTMSGWVQTEKIPLVTRALGPGRVSRNLVHYIAEHGEFPPPEWQARAETEKTAAGLILPKIPATRTSHASVEAQSDLNDDSAIDTWNSLKRLVESLDVKELTETLDAALREVTRNLFAVLGPRERDVIVKRLGFDRLPPHSLQQVATDLGVSRERVRQIELKALGKMRQAAGRGRFPLHDGCADSILFGQENEGGLELYVSRRTFKEAVGHLVGELPPGTEFDLSGIIAKLDAIPALRRCKPSLASVRACLRAMMKDGTVESLKMGLWQGSAGRRYRKTGLSAVATDVIDEHQGEVSIAELDLAPRSYRCLTRANMRTVGQLLERSASDLMKIRNFGASSLRDVRKALLRYDLSLKDDEGLFEVTGHVVHCDAMHACINNATWPQVYVGIRVDRRVRVELGHLPSITLPPVKVGDTVSVTGLSSLRYVGNTYRLIIRPRTSGDYQVLVPAGP